MKDNKRDIGVSRRQFMVGATSFATLFGSRAFAVPAGSVPTNGADVRFGVLSDVHLNRPGDEDTLRAAFRYFASQNVDGVIIAGDIADTGRIEQLMRCGACWNEVFPNGKGPDGRHVEKLFVYGNHDVDGWTYGVDEKTRADPAHRAACIMPEVRAAIWEKAFGEKFEPIWMKEVKGYTFIGAHLPFVEDLKGFLAKNAAKLGKTKPFFYIQHPHPRNTCFGSWAWGRDDGKSTEALSAFPNAVAFSGHSHYTLTDERTVWQGAFTSINTASLRYASVDYSLRENIGGNSHGFKGEGRTHRMPQVWPGDGRQGMIVSVCGDRLVIERREFVYGQSLGPDWIVPLPAERKPFSYAARAKGRVAPAFASGAAATVAITPPKDEKDFTHVELSFPAAKPVDGCRVFEYEATAVLCEDDVELVQAQRRMMSPDYYLPLSKLVERVSFTFAAEDIPVKGHYRFEIRPLECFGKKGAPIHVEADLK